MICSAARRMLAKRTAWRWPRLAARRLGSTLFRVVRMDTHGNQVVVAKGLGRSVAESLVTTFNDRNHKQHFWLEEQTGQAATACDTSMDMSNDCATAATAAACSSEQEAPVRLEAVVVAAQPVATHRLVVCHGVFGSAQNWRALAQRWALAGVEVHLLSARNHGRSEHSDVMTYTAMANDVRAYLSALDDELPCCVLGHSMGGKTCMVLALQSPALVDRLVVCDMAPVAYASIDAHLGFARAMKALDLTRVASMRDADRLLEPAVRDAGIRGFLLTNLRRDPATRRFGWLCNVDVLSNAAVLHTVRDWPAACVRGRAFAKPTLFLAGANSDYVDRAGLERSDTDVVHQWFPSAHVVTVPDAGHWLHADNPDVVFEQVMTFLKR